MQISRPCSRLTACYPLRGLCSLSPPFRIAQLVNLLKDGLKDGRVEAQEYALRSLLSLSDVTAKAQIVEAGCIPPLISCIAYGQLSFTATEHAAAVISGLAPLAENAMAIKLANGVDPIVQLLSMGTADAKTHAADTLAQLAHRAEASSELAQAGAVSAFVGWLANPKLGPPDVAARALSAIALDNQDTQQQIAEEGAIEYLVEMVGAWRVVNGPAEAVSQSNSAGSQPASLQSSPLHKQNASPENSPSQSMLAPVPAPREDVPVVVSQPAKQVTIVVHPTVSNDTSAAEGSSEPPPPVPVPAPVPEIDASGATTLLEGEQVADFEGKLDDAKQAISSNEVEAAEAEAEEPDIATRSMADVEAETEAEAKAMAAAEAEAARARAAAALAKTRATKQAMEVAIRVANVAAGALATLAKDNLVNQMMIAEEGGIQPLVDLLKTEAKSYESPTKALWHLAATEDNQTAIAKAGGIAPLVSLLSSPKEITAQYASAALRTLAREHPENQIALAKAGAIAPLVELLGSDAEETQEHSVGALLHLASQDVGSRNAVVRRLVAVLTQRRAAAQLKAAEALSALAARSDENRKAITAANAIEPLVSLLGDGRRVRRGTPQEVSALVLSDLAKSGDNKSAICAAGAVGALVAMLSSEAISVQTHAAAALAQLAAAGSNRPAIAEAGAIAPLVALLALDSADAQRFATMTLWHLASSADNKIQMVGAGIIPLLLPVLRCRSAEARENACAVFSALARTQGGNKKAIYHAGGIAPLVELLADARAATQRHAASALWGLSEGKDGIYDKYIAEAGAIPPLIGMLRNGEEESRGFAVACLLCICKDRSAHQAVLAAGAGEVLQRELLAHGQSTWLGSQIAEMLSLLGIGRAASSVPPIAHNVNPSDVPMTGRRTARQQGGLFDR